MIVRVLTTTTLLLGATVAQALTPVSRLPAAQLAAPNVQAALDREARAQGPRPLLWAVPVERELPTLADGSWETSDGVAVWRLPVAVAGAHSLGLALRSASLPASATVRVSSLDGSQLRGPYTVGDFVRGQLGVPVVNGEAALVELRVPAAEHGKVELSISRIDYGFRSFKDAPLKSGNCNVDVACPAAGGYDDPIRAVARYTVNHPGEGGYVCTGTLVNNTAQDGRPLFLTADHCFRNDDGEFSGDADTLVVYWNYEASSCGGARDGDLSQTQSGSILRATSAVSDFALLELEQRPPSAYEVFYAGWDRRDIAPSGAFGIHHPLGDEKAVSIEYDATTITEYGDNASDAKADFIRIADWDVGVTEGGSSGSALFSAEHRVVGTLSGGLAGCTLAGLGADDNGMPDWYGRLYAHWNSSASSDASLKPWLDPTGSNVTTLDGTDTLGNSFDDDDDDDDGGGSLSLSWLLIGLSAVLARRRPRRSSRAPAGPGPASRRDRLSALRPDAAHLRSRRGLHKAPSGSDSSSLYLRSSPRNWW